MDQFLLCFLSFEFLHCLCLEGEVGKIVLAIMMIFSKVVRRSELKEEIVFVIVKHCTP